MTDAALLRHLAGRRSPDSVLEGFLAWVAERGLSLYPAQEEAILELYAGKHVILATPTGSGKSLVALALHAASLAGGTRSFYTAPIKALVSEKFFALCRELGPDQVGLMTGDATVNRDAPVLCCTAEILANLALRQGADAPIGSVVMDEFHFYSDRDRGVAWQVPLLVLTRTQFLLMSGTLGDMTFFEQDLHARTGREVATVRSAERPVPLEFLYVETPLHETLLELVRQDRAPVYVVHFTQRAASELAQSLTSVDLSNKERKAAIQRAIAGFRWDSPYGKELSRLIKHGIGVHHAGLLPKYRLLVEKLAQRGLLAVICGTDTLGVGVNVPIRTVLFTRLCKFDGRETRILSVRDFHQIAGRAGRKGFDERGWVVAQAPEHVIENKIARERAEGDPKKLRKLVPKKPPERGYAHWDANTFARLVHGEPERLQSRFRVSHGMLLALLERAAERGEHGCRAIRSLIASSHDRRERKFQHGRHAIALLRSLVEANVVEIDRSARTLRVRPGLQDDFSLHRTLSLFVVDAVPRLDRADPLHALHVLSVVEAILEDPEVVLQRQLETLRERKLAELKAEGVEYEERLARLDEVDRPRPLAEWLEERFAEFTRRHPWAPRDGLRPKSIARDMWERGAGFSDYVKEYGLLRAEGALLRHLSDAYETLVQSVPESEKTEAVQDLVDWLGAIVRQVDSSLLDEWESLRDPERARRAAEAREADLRVAPSVTDDPKAFTVLVRNAMFRIVRALARRDWQEAASLVVAGDDEAPWSAARIEEAMIGFEREHGRVRTDPAARAPTRIRIERRPDAWRVVQTLLDDDEVGNWYLEARIDLARARAQGEPVVELVAIAHD